MVFISMLAGILTAIAVRGNLMAITTKILQQHAESLTTSALLGYVTATALCAMAAGATVGVVTLCLLVRLFRGNSAVGYAWPAECTSLSTWAFTHWHHYGRGYQVGLRVLGVEIALKGEVA
jgi:hypothetical protein